MFIFNFFIILSFLAPFFLSHAKLRSAHASATQIAVTVVLQRNLGASCKTKQIHFT